METLKTVQPGGIWEPPTAYSSSCQMKDLEYIAFIVPFSSNRIDNLKLFLLNMHMYLQTTKNRFKYQIIVAEQKESTLFNKGSFNLKFSKFL